MLKLGWSWPLVVHQSVTWYIRLLTLVGKSWQIRVAGRVEDLIFPRLISNSRIDSYIGDCEPHVR